MLIAAGADVNVGSNENYTPLMSAARNGHIQLFEQLVAARAAVNAVDCHNQTALNMPHCERIISQQVEILLTISIELISLTSPRKGFLGR
jgi:uncharacterized protein